VSLKEPLLKPWGQTVSYVRCPDGTLVEICSSVVSLKVNLSSCKNFLHHDGSIYIKKVTLMAKVAREKFSSQASPDVLTALRQIAELQGRQFQAVLDEALRDYIDRQQKTRPCRHVMASFASSLDEFDHLYRELAK